MKGTDKKRNGGDKNLSFDEVMPSSQLYKRWHTASVGRREKRRERSLRDCNTC